MYRDKLDKEKAYHPGPPNGNPGYKPPRVHALKLAQELADSMNPWLVPEAKKPNNTPVSYGD